MNKETTNVLIIGKSGVGKSSLLNYIFGREMQEVGVGAPVTKVEIKEFVYPYDEHFEIHIYDTWGLEPSAQKADQWKKTIFAAIADHDRKQISDWFNTIIFCLNAKSARIEDFELDIMGQLLREKNHLTIALTHGRSREDPDGITLRETIKNELRGRGIEPPEDRNFVFVSNVRKKLIGGTVEQFGREEILVSIIRNMWGSLKSKVPFQARKKFEELFERKRAELLKKPDKLHLMVPFNRMARINRLEREINADCAAFVRDLAAQINAMYKDAVDYYSELSKKYAIIGFELRQEDYETSGSSRFDALLTVEAQVTADLNLLKERIRFLNDILSDKRVESTLKDSIINFRVLVRDSKKIRRDLKAELDRYMNAVRLSLEEQLSEIEKRLAALEIDDLYLTQANLWQSSEEFFDF